MADQTYGAGQGTGTQQTSAPNWLTQYGPALQNFINRGPVRAGMPYSGYQASLPRLNTQAARWTPPQVNMAQPVNPMQPMNTGYTAPGIPQTSSTQAYLQQLQAQKAAEDAAAAQAAQSYGTGIGANGQGYQGD